MIRIIYAVRDRIANDLAGTFPLVVFRTDAQAVRYFGDSLATERSALAAHPDDYELVKLGTLADDGAIEPITPQIIITGAALVAASTDHQGKGNTDQQLRTAHKAKLIEEMR